MKVVDTAPMPGMRMPSFPLAGAIFRLIGDLKRSATRSLRSIKMPF
jgi:hypothetical protein